MNLFFGKISKSYNIEQITLGFYEAPRDSTWFGELKVGDYAYIIGGDKIQFWQAEEWKIVDGKDRLTFTILNDNLGIDINQFISLNFLNLSKALIVLSSRSARNKAFFKITTNRDVDIALLSNSEFYRNSDLYRKIKIVNDLRVDPDSVDIQLMMKDGKLQLLDAPYFDPNVYVEFRDNLKYYGQGSKFKDNVLAKIKAGLEENKIFDHKDLGLRSFYDAFFCEYKETANYYLLDAYWDTHDPQDLTADFVEDGVWVNGYEDKYNKETNAISPNSFVAIKSSYVRDGKSVMKIKARGVVRENKADGQNLIVNWEKGFQPFEVEIGGYRTTVNAVSKKEHIDAIWPTEYNDQDEIMDNQIIPLLKYKKQIILQGPPGTGKTLLAKEVAKVLSPLARTLTSEIIIKDITVGLVLPTAKGLANYKVKNVIADEGKIIVTKEGGAEASIRFERILDCFESRMWEKEITQADVRMATALAKYLFDNNPQVQLMQFHPSFTYEDFVRGIESEINDDKMGYRAKNKQLVRMANEATLHPDQNYILILDEINRANLSAVLGELIYALEYRGEDVESMYYVDGFNKISLPDNLYIIGTMNTADRSVGHIDYAIRRRFAFVDVLPKNLQPELNDEFDSELFNTVSKLFVKDYDPTIDYTKNRELLKNSVYLSAEFRPEDVWLGHSYFIKKEKATMAMRLEYEIRPILLEYIKDGVLHEEARVHVLALPNEISAK